MGEKKTKKASRPAVAKKTAPKKTIKKAPGKANSTAKKASKPVATKKAAVKKTVKKKATKPVVKKRASKKDEECFLTTACVNYYALADDAYELTTLRAFRDQYMLKRHEGKALVKQYYRVAPLIVSLIKKDKAHRRVYQYIYQCIQKACAEIEQRQYAIAQQTYTALVTHLSEKYSIKS